MREARRSGQGLQVEGGGVVYQAAILRANENAPGYLEVRAAAIDEGGTRLRTNTGRVFGIEQQASRACQRKRGPAPQRDPEQVGGGDFVRIALYAERVAGQLVILRIQRISVIHFHAAM